MNAGLQELPVATSRVWVPWPLRREQPMALLQPWTLMEPVQVKVVFMFTTPSSRAAARVRGLKVEPGSYVESMHLLRHWVFRILLVALLTAA